MGQAFEWYATDSAPSDYPAYLVEAFFQLTDGNIEGIPEFQINNGGWGRTGAIQIIGEDPKPVPAMLHVEWYDLVARQGYGGQIDLPSERIDDMMREGLVSPETGERMPVDFIAVGLAPGGDVALWVTAERVRHLVGMFKATPTQIPLDKLSNDPELSETQFVEKLLDAALPGGRAEEVTSAPVPEGQWVRYAERFDWRPKVTGEFAGDLLWIEFLNGEQDWFDLSGERERTASSSSASNFALPHKADFTFKGPTGQAFAAEVALDPDEVRAAFERLAQEAPGQRILVDFEPADLSMTVEVYLRAGDAFLRLEQVESQVFAT